jgi:hypothetical protein
LKITIVNDTTYGDWMAIYQDGKLLDQDHSFSAADFARLTGLEVEFKDAATADQNEKLFPEKLEDLK